MLANALLPLPKIRRRRRRARRSSVFGNALGNAAVRGIQNWQADTRANADATRPLGANPSFGPSLFGGSSTNAFAALGLPAPFGLSDPTQAGAASLSTTNGEATGAQAGVAQSTGSGGGTASPDGKGQYKGYAVPDYSQVDPSLNPQAQAVAAELFAHTAAYVNSVNAHGGSLPLPPAANDPIALVDYNHALQRGLYPSVAANPVTETELPAVENLYTPRVGYYENAYNTYAAGLDDPNASFGVRALGLLGAVATMPLAIPDMMVSGLYNAPNNAGIAGQYAARASLLHGSDRNLAALQSTSYGLNAFLGVGNVVTLGQVGAMSQARAPLTITADIASSARPRLAFQPSSGVILEATPGKTTTILGSYSQNMKPIVNELGNVKSTDFGPRIGGFNVLNVPDELYVTRNQFWTEYNQPWLSNAVTRSDPFLMATEPQFGSASGLFRLNDATGKLELSGFGKEYLYLRQSGFRYDPITKQMVRSP